MLRRTHLAPVLHELFPLGGGADSPFVNPQACVCAGCPDCVRGAHGGGKQCKEEGLQAHSRVGVGVAVDRAERTPPLCAPEMTLFQGEVQRFCFRFSSFFP